MLIPVSCSCEGGQVPEWGLVELQGKVEQQLDIEPGQNLPVGSLAASKTVRGWWLVFREIAAALLCGGWHGL